MLAVPDEAVPVRPLLRAARLALAVAALSAAAFSFASLRDRWRWERDRTVEICVDGRELAAMAPQGPGPSLGRLHAAGVSSVSVYWDGAAPSAAAADAMRPSLPAGVAMVLRPEPPPFSSASRGPVDPAGLAAFSSFLPAGPAVVGYPDLAEPARWVAASSWRLPSVEFSRQLGADSLARRFPDRVVRAHSLDEDEMARMTPEKLIARFRRAARERGIRFIYLRFFPYASLERNLAFAEELSAALRKDGFTLGPASPRYGEWPARAWTRGSPAARQAAAFLAACVLPLLFFRRALRSHSVWRAMLRLTLLDLGAALFVAALLSTPDFALGFYAFRGVKAALAVPLLLSVFTLYSPAELRSFAHRPVTVALAGGLAAAAAVLGLYLLRSGHGSVIEAGGRELQVRGWLETVFGVRPRFKEFMIGHPLLWLGFYEWTRQQRHVAAGHFSPEARVPWDPRPVLIAGFIGQLSVINTFCHPHMPLGLSLLRVAHGCWLGAVAGFALIVAVELLSAAVARFRAARGAFD